MNNKRGKNNRGLSTIVVTLIIILLSLVAVGVVWAVVNNLIKSGSEGVSVSSKCLNINIEATSVNCTDGTTSICDVTMVRSGTEDAAISGVKIVFRNQTSGVSSNVTTVAGNIEPLVGKKQTGIDTGILGVTVVEVTPFFLDTSGKEQLCTQSSSFEF